MKHDIVSLYRFESNGRQTLLPTIKSFPKPDHDHGQYLKDAMDTAERLCSERGVRITPARRRVLELVWRRHAPIGAYDILSEMQRDVEKDGKPETKVAPPTVYRALDFLMKQGFVHKIESQNAYIGCSHPEESHDCGFLICRECGSALRRLRTTVLTPSSQSLPVGTTSRPEEALWRLKVFARPVNPLRPDKC